MQAVDKMVGCLEKREFTLYILIITKGCYFCIFLNWNCIAKKKMLSSLDDDKMTMCFIQGDKSKIYEKAHLEKEN